MKIKAIITYYSLYKKKIYINKSRNIYKIVIKNKIDVIFIKI